MAIRHMPNNEKTAWDKIKSKKRLIAGMIIIAVCALYIINMFFPLVGLIKPFLEKPTLQSTITTASMNWVANELGAYGLHDSLLGEPPVIETIVDEQTFTTTVKDGVPVTTENSAEKPDIRITLTYEAFSEMYSSTDLKTSTKSLYESNGIKVDLLKDTLTLLSKGYKAVYDNLY